MKNRVDLPNRCSHTEFSIHGLEESSPTHPTNQKTEEKKKKQRRTEEGKGTEMNLGC